MSYCLTRSHFKAQHQFWLRTSRLNLKKTGRTICIVDIIGTKSWGQLIGIKKDNNSGSAALV